MRKSYILPIILLTSTFSLLSCEPPSDIVIDDKIEKFEDGATEIKMWMMDFEEWENRINIYQRKLFNDNLSDGIQLSQTYIDSNSFDDLIRGAYESNSVPDIYTVSYGNLYKEINAGRAIDITNYFSEDVWNDLTDTAKEGVCYDDKYYGFPIVMEPSTLVAYRKDLLQTYGNTTSIPTTWDDFLELCSTIKTNLTVEGKRNVYPFGVPTGVACAWGTWGMQYAATGGLAITDDWTTSRIMEPGYAKLAEVWQQLYGNGYVPLSSGDYTESIFDVCDGKAIMTTCGSWSISTIANQYPEMIDNIGFAVMPTFDGNQDTVTATNGGWVYVISSECENVEMAAEVIKFLTAEDTAQTVDYFTRAYYSKVSPRKSVQAILDVEMSKETTIPNEWYETVNYVASRAVLEPIYSWDISVSVEGLLEEAAMGENIDDVVAECHKEVQDIIVRDNLANNNPRQ